jgi:hypothetical protein
MILPSANVIAKPIVMKIGRAGSVRPMVAPSTIGSTQGRGNGEHAGGKGEKDVKHASVPPGRGSDALPDQRFAEQWQSDIRPYHQCTRHCMANWARSRIGRRARSMENLQKPKPRNLTIAGFSIWLRGHATISNCYSRQPPEAGRNDSLAVENRMTAFLR